MRRLSITARLALLLLLVPLSACNVLNLELGSRDADGEGGGALAAIKGIAGGILDAGEATEAGGAAKSGAKTEYFQYTDERGSVRFVRSLHEVPAQFRDQVGRLEVEKQPARSAAPRATATRTIRAGGTPAVRKSAAVTVYSTAWCGWCRKTVEWLDDRGVAYENRDVEANDTYREEIVSYTGGTSVPVVVIDGEVVRGFDPDRMKELIGKI
ncbi:MAG: glutaredoxin family protein [Myxococcales bacterium]|nr:glutaredoxin family protein [Myxococcales bacterium]